jgi:methionyl aminopeptidase
MMPYIIHTPNDFPGEMHEGHTFTIEPVVVEGSTRFKVLADGWTARGLDMGRSAQVEHTILITATGSEILTIPSPQLLKQQ